MPEWLLIANGPVLRFAIAFLILGLLRLVVMIIIQMIVAVQRAGDKQISYSLILKDTAKWLIPFQHIHKTRRIYSYASYLFHIGILLSGLFLANHLEIMKIQVGISWLSIWKPLLDAVTVMSFLGGLYLLIHRIYVSGSRQLSSAMDYLLLVFLLNILISGFVAGQNWNPIPYNHLMLFHTFNGVVLLLLIPFTKISHCILYPFIRLSSEIGWHFPAQAGQRVIEVLHGPEGRKI